MWKQPLWGLLPSLCSVCLEHKDTGLLTRTPLPPLYGLVPTPPPSPVFLEAVGGCDHPAVGDEGPPTDVAAPNLEAGLPRPLTL